MTEDYTYVDAAGVPLAEGTRVKMAGDPSVQDYIEGTVVGFTDPDGDSDDEGGYIAIAPTVTVRFDGGDEDTFHGLWQGTGYWDDAPFGFDDVEVVRAVTTPDDRERAALATYLTLHADGSGPMAIPRVGVSGALMYDGPMHGPHATPQEEAEVAWRRFVGALLSRAMEEDEANTPLVMLTVDHADYHGELMEVTDDAATLERADGSTCVVALEAVTGVEVVDA